MTTHAAQGIEAASNYLMAAIDPAESKRRLDILAEATKKSEEAQQVARAEMAILEGRKKEIAGLEADLERKTKKAELDLSIRETAIAKLEGETKEASITLNYQKTQSQELEAAASKSAKVTVELMEANTRALDLQTKKTLALMKRAAR